MIQIFDYSFSKKLGELDVCNFLTNLDKYLSEYNTIKQKEPQIINNFYSIVLNLQKMMAFMDINYTWLTIKTNQKNMINNNLIKNTKQLIYNMIAKSFYSENYTNIIFIFHKHTPFTYSTERVYKLLINTITTEQNKNYDLQYVLSLILSDAAMRNNYYAIKILTSQYKVSPITLIASNTMPILQIFSQNGEQIYKQYFMVLPQEKEYNFISMLHTINFLDPNIEYWKIQKIFRCTFQNNLKQALNYLLDQKIFWTKLILEEEDIILIAYSIVTQLDHNNLVNIIFNHPNVLNNSIFKANFIQQHINHYINIINQIIYFNDSSNNTLKTIINFTKYFLTLQYNNNLIYNEFINKLQQENKRLENMAFIYNLEVAHLEEQLKQMTLDTRAISTVAVDLSNKYNYLLSQFHQIHSTTNPPTKQTLKSNNNRLLRHSSF